MEIGLHPCRKVCIYNMCFYTYDKVWRNDYYGVGCHGLLYDKKVLPVCSRGVTAFATLHCDGSDLEFYVNVHFSCPWISSRLLCCICSLVCRQFHASGLVCLHACWPYGGVGRDAQDAWLAVHSTCADPVLVVPGSQFAIISVLLESGPVTIWMVPFLHLS